MNERIRQLAEQAGYRDIFDNDTKARARLEKYTELIVRECAVIADEPTSQPFSSYGEKIKQHFGVKE